MALTLAGRSFLNDARRILELFYDKIRATPAVRKFFSDERRIDGAKSAQLRHWTTIVSGDFDQRYVESVRAIGNTHARIGLEPRWYIAGYALILEQLMTAVVEASWPKGFGVSRDGRFG